MKDEKEMKIIQFGVLAQESKSEPMSWDRSVMILTL